MSLQQATQHRGIPWQIYHQISGVFVHMVKRHHVFFAVFFAPPDSVVMLTPEQRIAVLACLLFTSMCVTALLFGRRPDQVEGRIIAGEFVLLFVMFCLFGRELWL